MQLTNGCIHVTLVRILHFIVRWDSHSAHALLAQSGPDREPYGSPLLTHSLSSCRMHRLGDVACPAWTILHCSDKVPGILEFSLEASPVSLQPRGA